MKTTLDRFEAKYIPEPNTGCWLWTAALSDTGYGEFTDDKGKRVKAYRFAYETFIAPIPQGLEPDHLCRLRCCVSPYHLEAVTHRVNVLRGQTVAALNLTKTHCPQGHPYDAANTYREKKNGSDKCRRCLVCKRARDNRRYHRKAA